MTRQEKQSKIKDIIAEFQRSFPAAFPTNPLDIRPLKIGIAHNLFDRIPGADPRLISLSLLVWTRRTFYLKSILTSSGRIDLDGARAGDVTREQRQYAKIELKRVYNTLKKKNATRAKAPSRPQRTKKPRHLRHRDTDRK